MECDVRVPAGSPLPRSRGTNSLALPGVAAALRALLVAGGPGRRSVVQDRSKNYVGFGLAAQPQSGFLV